MLHEPALRYRHVDRVLGTAWLARHDLLQRSRIDQMLSVEDGCPMLVRANGVGKMYSADPYNYVRMRGAEIMAPTLAAKLDERAPIEMGGAEIMI